MKIDLAELKRYHWFEDCEGHIVEKDDPKAAVYRHCFPLTLYDDLISRKTLLEKLGEVSDLMRQRAEKEGGGFLAVQVGVTLAKREVDAAPTIDAGETAYRFYYCESEDSYLLGHRAGNFYYAHWHDKLGFVWDMSRYLPWGSGAFPSEPREISVVDWFSGFLQTIDVEPVRRGRWKRRSGCEWCADNYDHRHKTMFRKGSDWNYEAKYCDMCGKRLEEHHEAD